MKTPWKSIILPALILSMYFAITVYINILTNISIIFIGLFLPMLAILISVLYWLYNGWLTKKMNPFANAYQSNKNMEAYLTGISKWEKFIISPSMKTKVQINKLEIYLEKKQYPKFLEEIKIFKKHAKKAAYIFYYHNAMFRYYLDIGVYEQALFELNHYDDYIETTSDKITYHRSMEKYYSATNNIDEATKQGILAEELSERKSSTLLTETPLNGERITSFEAKRAFKEWQLLSIITFVLMFIFSQMRDILSNNIYFICILTFFCSFIISLVWFVIWRFKNYKNPIQTTYIEQTTSIKKYSLILITLLVLAFPLSFFAAPYYKAANITIAFAILFCPITIISIAIWYFKSKSDSTNQSIIVSQRHFKFWSCFLLFFCFVITICFLIQIIIPKTSLLIGAFTLIILLLLSSLWFTISRKIINLK